MKKLHIDSTTKKILGWYADDIHGTWIEPVYEKKIIQEETKDDDGNIVQNVVFEDVLVKDGFYDVSNIPTPNIEVSDEEWQKAISINANCFENGKFIVKDFSTLEQKISGKLSLLKNKNNYEAPTECLNISWVGGYDSAQRLNAKLTLCLELGLESCTFTDNDDTDHVLTLQQAKEVCITIATEFEARRASYKEKKRRIESCTTVEELEEIKI